MSFQTQSDGFGFENATAKGLTAAIARVQKEANDQIQKLKAELVNVTNNLNSKSKSLANTQEALKSTSQTLAIKETELAHSRKENSELYTTKGVVTEENRRLAAEVDRLEQLASTRAGAIKSLETKQASEAALRKENATALKAAVSTLEAAVKTNAVLLTSVDVIEKQNKVFKNTLSFEGDLNSESVKETALAEAAKATADVQSAEAIILGSS